MERLPEKYRRFGARFPKLMQAYEALGTTAREAGPLEPRTQRLIHLGMAIGAGLEGATHAHARQALQEGCSAEEIRHAAVLALTTLGFPTMMAGLAWVEDVLGRAESEPLA